MRLFEAAAQPVKAPHCFADIYSRIERSAVQSLWVCAASYTLNPQLKLGNLSMNLNLVRRATAQFALASLALFAATRAFAGPPLICHPYEIGAAKSLPTGTDRFGTSSSYDRDQHLVPDTLALLTASTPILERMETLRRAAIYATGKLRIWDGQKYTNVDKELAATLITKLRERTTTTDNAARAIALFDLGFFTETVRQTGLDPSLDGYAFLVQAAESLRNNPDVEFALALASALPKRPEHAVHLAKARAAAQPGSLLAANLESHFGKS
jgi:hypothetical protein